MFTRSLRGKAAAEKRRELRDQLFPGAEKLVWSRKADDGFCTVPRTLPLIMTLINEIADKRQGDASRVYHELWCRSYDEGFIEIGDEEEHAYAVRGRVRSWQERIQALADLGFIRVEPKGKRKFGYVLLVHPHDVVEELRKKNVQLPPGWYNLYLDRVTRTGARMGRVRKANPSALKSA